MNFDCVRRDLIVEIEDVREQQLLRNYFIYTRTQARQHRPFASTQV